ncbi:hypothetical protein QZM82_32010 [Burkholderia cepacia]|uniref:hypothetical protein n=1 Tax=Burkholderia cepacia TaxID=292 RepID=UPI002652F395|nr:hypothetical protein [Burkholderia cepacia]MDN7900826.1 hypothetical protein [Burkholderia cepacia]
MSEGNPTRFRMLADGVHVFDDADAFNLFCRRDECHLVAVNDALYFVYKRQLLIGPLAPDDITVLTGAELPVIDPWVSKDSALQEMVFYGIRPTGPGPRPS